ncbi:hypothetical protein C8Q80DRAFT_530980 [Daedaleopsis nitida]|nr:hypothetical protein C8Q80DRAFT_530980 [Daedaleopsis nitida]
MDTTPEYRFVSLRDANFRNNHFTTRSSGADLSHIRTLLPHYLPATVSPRLVPAPNQHYTIVSRDVSGVPTLVPVMEFTVPLQLARATYSSSDLQSNSSAIPSTPRHPYIAHVVERPLEDARRSDMLSQPSAFITAAIAGPEYMTGGVPSCANSPVVFGGAISAGGLSTTARLLDDRSSLHASSPNDTCHVATSDSGNLYDLAFPPPVLACNSPDLLCAEHDASKPLVQDAQDSSVAAASRIWSLPSSIPSMSFSGSEDNLPPSLSYGKISYNDLLRLSLSPPLYNPDEAPSVAPPIGIYADVNMRQFAIRAQSPPLCVNPADVMTDSLRMSSPSSTLSGSPELDQMPVCVPDVSAPASRELSPVPDFKQEFSEDSLISADFSNEAISAIVSMLKSSETSQAPRVPHPGRSDQENACLNAGPSPCKVVAPQPMYPPSGHVYPGNDLGILHSSHHSVSAGGSEVPGPDARSNKRMPLADIYLPQSHYVGPSYTIQYLPPVEAYAFPALAHSHPAPVAEPLVPPEPVLNAHLGVSLEDIRRRAAEYRQRNGGAELDKSFLQCFAGRLTARGELMEEYRCYISGCEQRNRRRDHILVHVGSHVEHRPWACRHCGMRFLRKNECKRHESSHDGKKPFSCPLCAPVQERCFVRQDLLKRHLRVTHGVQDEKRRKKGPIIKNESEDWP